MAVAQSVQFARGLKATDYKTVLAGPVAASVIQSDIGGRAAISIEQIATAKS
jgi:hypothetical protein